MDTDAEKLARDIFPQYGIYEIMASPVFAQCMRNARDTADKIAYKAITGEDWAECNKRNGYE